MKKLFYLVLAAVLFAVGCSESFDDSKIWDKLDDHESRISQLEELCKQMNTNISSLQTLVSALNQKEFITNVAPISKNGEEIGYTITFTSGKTITIYHGQDGTDGKDGINGADGKDGSTPIIGVKKASDNIYYWTLNGEWLLDDDGNKIKAVGTDGKDGQNGADGTDGKDGEDGQDGATGPQGPQGPAGENGADGEDGKDGQNGADGKDGITPQLKIEEGYWYISYDNGSSWKQLGKATGEDGKDGQDGKDGEDGADGADGKDGQDGADGKDGADGDSFFQGVDLSNEDYIIFTLADGTQFKIPTWTAYEKLQTLCNQLNTNIASLQTIIDAMQNNDFVKSITPIMENGKEIGYTITFTKSGTITIYHGKDGQNGQDGAVGPQGPQGPQGPAGENGADGKDGQDGSTPIIGVKKDADNIYYWTVNGEWLLDENGNKIKAQGTDGKDGQNGTDGKDGEDGQDGNDGATGPQGPQGPAGENGADGEDGKDGQNGADGKDGITPQLKIEKGYWYISYDNGSSWKQLGKATGEDGKDGQNGADGEDGATGPQGPQGEQGPAGADGKDGQDGKDGDSFFQNVTQDEHNVYFILADGTEIVAAKYIALQLYFDISSLTDVKVNSEVNVNYTVATSASKVDIEALPSNDLRAEVVADDATNKTGYILIHTSNTFDAASKVVVLVSDGEKVVMKSISLQVIPEEEAAQLYIYNGATKNVGSAGGTATLSFLTNVDCEAVIPDDAKSWISVAETRALENKHITLTVAENTSDRRSAKVKVQSLDGKLSVEYTISQAAPASPSTPEVGGDGTILGTPAKNEIFYTSKNGTVVAPYTPSAFGAAIVSNTYANGVGVIVFDRNITTIGDSAFCWLDSLTSIAIPDSVTTIGNNAFHNCDYLKSITIPDSVTKIGEWAFDGCSSLTSVTIPDSVTTIENGAFSGCSSLTTVTIPDSVTTIGEGAFSGCSSLTSITIPDNVTTIGEGAFYRCSSLTTITIPDSVTTIGYAVFSGCSSLTSITIPDSVTTIGIETFQHCSSLTDVTIPDSVTEIGNLAFSYCSSLTSVTIGDSVTTIGKWAFIACSSLTTITISDSVTTIGEWAFCNCTNLTSVTIGDSVTTIGYSAFKGCSSLTKAVIGSGVKKIGNSAFENCYFLNEVICKPTTPPVAIFDSGVTEWNAFNAIGTSAKIYVPIGSGTAYKTAKYWSDYASIIVEKAM